MNRVPCFFRHDDGNGRLSPVAHRKELLLGAEVSRRVRTNCCLWQSFSSLDQRLESLHRLRSDKFGNTPESGVLCSEVDYETQMEYGLGLSAGEFLSLPRSRKGSVSYGVLELYLTRTFVLASIGSIVREYADLQTNCLREVDLENFVFDVIPSAPGLSALPREFYNFYVFHAVSCFVMDLDPCHSGKVPVDKFIRSKCLQDFVDVLYPFASTATIGFGMAPLGSQQGWFTYPCALRVYNMYLDLDTNGNGMLSAQELLGYGSVTQFVVDRIFEQCQSFDGELDYKGFLSFALAFDRRSHFASSVAQASISDEELMSLGRYFFALFDLNGTKSFGAKEIHAFLRGMTRGNEKIIADMSDEILDIYLSAKRGQQSQGVLTVTEEEFCKNPLSCTVISLLTDSSSFQQHTESSEVPLA